MILPFAPIFFVDLVGSVMMIVLSVMCVRIVGRLKMRERDALIWTYLLWITMGLIGFSLSRSVGHILKQVLVLSGKGSYWRSISPYSGAVNTMMFILASSITLFFEQAWKIHREILSDKKELQSTRDELIYLNQNLERMMTERTKELQQSEHRYRRIFELSKDMILVTRKNGIIVDLNPIGYTLLGFPGDADLTGRQAQNFFCNKSDWTNIMETITRDDSVSNAEIDLLRQDGTYVRTLIAGSLDIGTTDPEDQLHFLIKDIHSRRLMEQQMAQADKLASIGELSSGIAHEINNPLGIILGYTQLLLRKESPATERYSDLKTIEKHVRSCKIIVENLLNFARSSPTEKAQVHIHDIMDDAVNFIQQHSKSGRISIIKEYDPGVPSLILDDKKLKQVFINLIMNARHAVGDEGTIRLATRFDPSSDLMRIHVSDNGYGIEEKNLTRIFDPFFTTKPTGQGTGLGLSVSYGIIKSHGGQIDVISTPGEGSEFIVTLPIDLTRAKKNV